MLFFHASRVLRQQTARREFSNSPCRKALFSLVSKFRCPLNTQIPAFPVDGDKVDFLSGPSEFYDTLNDLVRKSENRIHLSALYLGTDQLSMNLVKGIVDRSSMVAGLNVSLLVDAARAQRVTTDERDHGLEISTMKVLEPLLQACPSTAALFLLSPPTSLGHLSKWIPGKLREVLSVHHLKLYVIDNNVIVSGANLSKAYFTQRQDRYMVIRDNQMLADFCTRVLQLLHIADFTMKWDAGARKRIPGVTEPAQFRDKYKALLQEFGSLSLFNSDAHSKADTLVYPMLQVPGISVRQDSQFTEALFRFTNAHHADLTWAVSTGYCNLHSSYARTLLKSDTPTPLLCASESANGFYKARGFLGTIPALYTALLWDVVAKAPGGSIIPHLYEKAGWSFHAKGLWSFCTGESWAATLVGSSNFGYRSVQRDTEMSLFCISTNLSFQTKLRAEYESLQKDCHIQPSLSKPSPWHLKLAQALRGVL